MMKKSLCFFIFSIFCAFSTHTINKQALEYLEKLREKEYVALRKLCRIGRMPQQEIEQIIQFYKDFKHIHAKKFFSQKNADFFHDPKLAEFNTKDSNVLEETKKILRECGINPESITIRYKETHEKEQTVASVYCDVKNAEILKDLGSLTGSLNSTNFHHELTIRTSLIKQGGLLFSHAIRHEIGHLLEGDAILTKLLSNNKNYIGGNRLRKINNEEIVRRFSKEIGTKASYIEKTILSMLLKELCRRYEYFKYRKEALTDVRMYFETKEESRFLVTLCWYYVNNYKCIKKIRSQWFLKIRTRLKKFFRRHTWETHPTNYSTYKRLLKINDLTWKIPYEQFEVSEDAIKEVIQEKLKNKNT